MIRLKEKSPKKQTSIADLIHRSPNTSDEILDEFDFNGWKWTPKYAIFLDVENYIEVGEWCKKNCKNRWYTYLHKFWFFENMEDAMAFKMCW